MTSDAITRINEKLIEERERGKWKCEEICMIIYAWTWTAHHSARIFLHFQCHSTFTRHKFPCVMCHSLVWKLLSKQILAAFFNGKDARGVETHISDAIERRGSLKFKLNFNSKRNFLSTWMCRKRQERGLKNYSKALKNYFCEKKLLFLKMNSISEKTLCLNLRLSSYGIKKLKANKVDYSLFKNECSTQAKKTIIFITSRCFISSFDALCFEREKKGVSTTFMSYSDDSD